MTHEQQHDDEPTSIAELEAAAEREAAEAETRARAAEIARERLHVAKQARRAEQLEPLRQRQRELAAQLAEIDTQMQAIIAGALAEGRSLYRAALDLYRERRTVADHVLTLGGAGTEPIPKLERFVWLALGKFQDVNKGWEEIDDAV